MENRAKFQSMKNDNNIGQLGKTVQSIKKQIEEEKKFVSFASCPDKQSLAYDSTDLEHKKPHSDYGGRMNVEEARKQLESSQGFASGRERSIY